MLTDSRKSPPTVNFTSEGNCAQSFLISLLRTFFPSSFSPSPFDFLGKFFFSSTETEKKLHQKEYQLWNDVEERSCTFVVASLIRKVHKLMLVYQLENHAFFLKTRRCKNTLPSSGSLKIRKKKGACASEIM